VIDYRAVDFADAFKNVDIVLESVGGDYGERSLRTLRPGGLFITIVDRLNEELAQRARAAGKRFAGFSVEPDQVGPRRTRSSRRYGRAQDLRRKDISARGRR
jgi:NADPH:quinone reductase-like Zn-dependent oxidoreductase